MTMKTKGLITVTVFALVLWNCSGQNEKKVQEKKLTDEELLTNENDDTGELPVYDRTMLENLSEEALEEIKQSIATSDTLNNIFLFQQEGYDDCISKEAYKVMERMMQTRVDDNYEGKYFYARNWACQDTVAAIFLKYLRHKDPSITKLDSVQFQRVVNDFSPLMDYCHERSQGMINTATFINETIEQYRTIGAYKEILKYTDDSLLHRAYFNDYIEWEKILAAMDKRHHGDYRMYAMVINAFGSEMMWLRTTMLYEELALLRNRQPCTWNVTENVIDWNTEDADLLRPWFEQRLSYCDSIADRQFADSYRLMTEKIVYTYLNTISFGLDE